MWTCRGFSGEHIKERSLPIDIREHSVLGTTYRVRIESLSTTDDHITSRKTSIRIEKADAGPSRPAASSSAGASLPASSGEQPQPVQVAGGFSNESMKQMQKLARQSVLSSSKAAKDADELMATAAGCKASVSALLDALSPRLSSPQFADVPPAIASPMKSLLEDVAKSIS